MKTHLILFLGATAGAHLHPRLGAASSETAPPSGTQVSIVVDGDKRLITADGLPDHATGRFPGPGNPNRIAPQRYTFRVTTTPQPAPELTPVRMNLFGVAMNGVVFDPAAAEWWRDDRRSGWQYEALGGGRDLGVDAQHAHVQPTGAYHYHGMPTALLARLTDGKSRMVLVGWAADGFPIYGPWVPADAYDPGSSLKRAASSYRVKAGARPTGGPSGDYDGTFIEDYEYAAGSGDLDECNGRAGPTPEYPEGTYYYVLTDEFPFVPRLWRGAPDESFLRRRPPPRHRPESRSGL